MPLTSKSSTPIRSAGQNRQVDFSVGAIEKVSLNTWLKIGLPHELLTDLLKSIRAKGEDEGGLDGEDRERQQQPLRESQREREREREMEMERKRDRGTRGSFGDGDRGEGGAHTNDGFSYRSRERERERSRERETIRDSRNRGGRHECPHGGGGGYRGPSPSHTGGRGGDRDGKDRERGSLERHYRPPDAEELSEADKHDIDLTDLTDSEIAFQIKACYKRTFPRKCEIKWDNVRFLWKAKTCGRGKEFTPYTKRDMWVKYKGAVEWCEQKLVHWQAREYKGEGGDRERRSGGSFNQPPGALSDAVSQTPSVPAAVLFHPPACAALPPPPSRSKEETLETAPEDQVLTFLPRQRETVETAPEDQVLTFLPRQRETVETAPEDQVLTFLPRQRETVETAPEDQVLTFLPRQREALETALEEKDLTFLPRQREPEIRPPKRSAAYHLAGANGAEVPPPHCVKMPGCIRRMPQWRGDRDVDTSGYPHEYKHHHPPPESRIPMLPPPKILMPPQRRQADENPQWSSTCLASPASLGYSKIQNQAFRKQTFRRQPGAPPRQFLSLQPSSRPPRDLAHAQAGVETHANSQHQQTPANWVGAGGEGSGVTSALAGASPAIPLHHSSPSPSEFQSKMQDANTQQQLQLPISSGGVGAGAAGGGAAGREGAGGRKVKKEDLERQFVYPSLRVSRSITGALRSKSSIILGD
eukprot:Cvel_12588.t1-p1 / transcript=Cvel_12588.t1 / gene=Cvel_12588 / organism=Chromera_velia_CCMP2878 / gene_product=hypothetical protein / transcript_product=hypothetical protein / location=Cvel_scaffold829:56266-61496(+) / protein_length=700 / sequence_SO=supercontig / SO=protein_coding / is_pseudo=false